MNKIGGAAFLCALLFPASCVLNTADDSARDLDLTSIRPESVKALTKKGCRLAD